LMKNLSADEDVQIKSLTNDQTILVLAGPKAREVLSAVSRDDWSKTGFPWLSVRECFIGIAPATVMGVSFSGELAFEIHIPNASLYAAYLALREAGNAHGLRIFGALAVESMRLEKGYLHWKADILTEFDPFETGLNRFVKMDKPDFVGKAALAKRQAEGLRKQIVTLTLDSDFAPAHGGASVMVGDKVVGTVTSGGWGYRLGLNLAYAFVDPDVSKVGTTFEVDVLGQRIAATVSPMGAYDPTMALVRG
jgi:dimethylglycine dehydrogenase